MSLMTHQFFTRDDNPKFMSMNKIMLLLSAFFSCGGLNHVSEGPMNKWRHCEVKVLDKWVLSKWLSVESLMQLLQWHDLIMIPTTPRVGHGTAQLRRIHHVISSVKKF